MKIFSESIESSMSKECKDCAVAKSGPLNRLPGQNGEVKEGRRFSSCGPADGNTAQRRDKLGDEVRGPRP